MAVLEARGTVPGTSLGTMIGTMQAFEDSLSSGWHHYSRAQVYTLTSMQLWSASLLRPCPCVSLRLVCFFANKKNVLFSVLSVHIR
jgi:hypothetical protein